MACSAIPWFVVTVLFTVSISIKSHILPTHIIEEYVASSGLETVPTVMEIVYPKQSERWKRSGKLDQDEQTHMTLDVFGETHIIKLEHSGDFFTTPFMEYCGDGGLRLNAFPINIDKTCFVSGYIKEVENSLVALKACDGDVYGWVIGNYTLFLHPIREEHISYLAVHGNDTRDDKPRAHIAFKIDEDVNDNFMEDILTLPKDFNNRTNQASRNKTQWEFFPPPKVDKPFYVELMVAVDNTLQERLGNATIPYILSMVNMVATVYKHPSLEEIEINIRLSRLILVDENTCRPSLDLVQPVVDRLQNFINWSKEINYSDDTHPLHFDHGFLFTAKPWNEKRVLGVTLFQSVCGGAGTCQALKTVSCFGHELGHALGLLHDVDICPNHPERGIMTNGWYRFTECNIHQFRYFLSDAPECILDIPNENTTWPWPGYDVGERMYPGEVFTPDVQCRGYYWGNSIGECPWKSMMIQNFVPDQMCKLYCEMEDGKCDLWGYNIDGAPCGPGKTCVKGKCLCKDRKMCHPELGYGPPPSHFSYTAIPEAVDRDTAVKICQARNATLAKILNIETYKYFVKYLTLAGISSISFHIDGRRYPDHSNVWETVDGDRMSFFNWDNIARDEPDNEDGKEECIILMEDTLLFADVNCNDRHPFICQKEKES